ncbi:MAG: hypothetical protein ACRECW_11060 [Phyllobacterium sp.]
MSGFGVAGLKFKLARFLVRAAMAMLVTSVPAIAQVADAVHPAFANCGGAETIRRRPSRQS